MTVRLAPLHARRTALRVDLRRFLPPALLAGYGLLVLSLFARGVLSWYINPTYIGPTVLAGAVLVGLAVVGATRRPETGCLEGGCETDACCSSDPAPRVWTYGLLTVPLVLAVLFPPRSLAAFSANQRGPQLGGLSSLHSGATVKHVSLSVDTRLFTLQDWIGALSADPNPRDYLRKPIIISGLVVHSSSSVPPGYVMVLRYLVTCCIADARPVGLVVRDTTGGRIKDNQWVTVSGVMGETTYQGQQLAIVIPSKITPTKSESPYIY